ncbi:phage tail spike protein [Oceanobacillus alkalisoli]|uniref:phage tail spike protein n=1 Tax=Oceanobacillus alkalisoli TaxID=2925113 RepID=UPI001F11FA4B|nr:phage tail spike protein [Oceanobacillus alkalisoli]MCF3942219.1 hypothetical protein [Oceanobacillus alkalisoli]
MQVGEVAHTGLRTIVRENHTDPFSALKSLANTFDLELKFRIEIEGNRITRYADLVKRIGEWNGRYVEFGKDLQSIRRKEETDPITALLVIGPEREDGERLEVFVEDEDARKRWGRRGQHIVAVYEPQTDNEDITEERLRTLGRTELDKRINAVISFEASIVDLEHVPGMENKKIRFGDTIRIKDTSFNPPLFVDARIYKQNRDIFNPASKRVQLGDFTEYTVEQIRENWESIREELEKKIRDAEERAKWRASHGSKIIAVMSIRSQKVGVDSQYTEIIDNPDLDSTLRGQLTVAKVSYDVSYDSLMTTVEAKDKLDNPTESDVEEVYGLLGLYESELANISELLERAMESISKNYTDDHIQEVNRELDEAGRRIDDARDDIDRARGDLDIARDELDQTKIDLNDSRERLEDAEDNLRNAREDLNQLEGDLRDAESGLRDKVDFVDYNARIDELVGDISNKVDELDYSRKIDEITSDIADKVDGEWVDGRLRVAIEDIEVGGRNLIGHFNIIEGGWIDSNGEVNISSYGRVATDFIEVSSETNFLTFNYDKEDYPISSVKYALALYDENHDFIVRLESDNTSSPRTFELSNDTRYVRLSYPSSIRKYDDFAKLEKGNKATDWSPAPEDIWSNIDNKADAVDVYIKADVDDMFDNTVSLTAYETDQEGYIERFRDYESNVYQTWEAIGGMLNRTDYVEDQGTLEERLTEWERTADGFQQNVSQLRTEFDNIEIGGRNLALNSRLDYIPSGGSYGNVTVRELVNDDVHGKVLHIQSQYLVAMIDVVREFEVGDEVTFSVYGKALESSAVNVKLSGPHTSSIPLEIGTEWRQYSITTTIEGTEDGNLYLNLYPYRTEFWLKWIKVEKGNQATDWSSAPEDGSNRIESLSSQLNQFADRIEAMVEREELINYVDKTTYTREYGELITEFGKISGTVENVESILDTATGNISSISEQVGQLEIESDNITTSVSDLRGDFDNLEVGGRNLFLNSLDTQVRLYGDGTILNRVNDVTVSEWNTDSAKRAYGTAGSSSNMFATLNSGRGTRTSDGQAYVHSIYIKNNSGGNRLFVSNNRGVNETVYPGEIKRVVIHGIGNGTAEMQFVFSTPGTYMSFDFTYWQPQIEEGNKVTNWTPAPEDSITYTETRITQLADEISLNYIKDDELIAGIRIGDADPISGAHVQITGDTDIYGRISAPDATFLKISTEEMYALEAEIENSKIIGTLDANEATFQKGKFDEAHLVKALIDEAEIIDADITDATITGTLNGVDGRFTGQLDGVNGTFTGRLSAATGSFAGELSAATGTFAGSLTAASGTFKGDLQAAGGTFRGNMEAGSITSNTTIDVTTDVSVGNKITLGESGAGENNIDFYRGSQYIGRLSAWYIPSNGNRYMEMSMGHGYASIQLGSFMRLSGDVVHTGDFRTNGNIEASGELSADKLTTVSTLGYTVNSHAFIRPRPGYELRVADVNGNYSVLRADIVDTSSEKYKMDILPFEESGLGLLRESVFYDYRKKSSGKREIGMVIERETPEIFLHDDEAINGYTHRSINSIAIQELDTKVIQLDTKFEDEISQLKTENQLLKNEIEILKEKIA